MARWRILWGLAVGWGEAVNGRGGKGRNTANQKYRLNQTSHRQRHRGVYREAAQLEMCGHLKLTPFGSWTS